MLQMLLLNEFQYFSQSFFKESQIQQVFQQKLRMEKSTRVQPKQLINGQKHFFRQAIENIQKVLPDVEKDYQSVAIIGVQNSGKSTLLNNLFGTNFEVLTKLPGERTTLGIWVSLDKQANIIIMDVQGNDAEKRSHEPQYEKMVSTFALVQADTLIINVWSKTLGQYTGSQYQTLNAVLQICISQFKQQSPKTLLFCVRDFNDEEDEEGQIRRKITKDVNNIWAKIQKPTEIAKYKDTPEKFFSIEVSVLRKYRKENPKYFLEDVAKLRERFINSRAEGYVFKGKKNSFNLPLKDLPQLAENSWNSIITNKKLNLPNEKEQLSNFRCSQILEQLLVSFKTQIDQIEKARKVTDFGKIFAHYTKQFQERTYNYGKHIVEQKQKVLKQQMNDTIKRVINEVLDIQEKLLKEEFRNNSTGICPQNSKSLENALNELKDATIEKYVHVFKNFNYEIEERKDKVEKLSNFFTKENSQSLVRIKQLFNAEFQKQCSRDMRLLSSQVLKKYFGKSFWRDVQKEYSFKRELLIKSYSIQVQWMQNRALEPNQIDAIDQKLGGQLKKSIREEFQKSLMSRVFDLFMKQFTKNDEGVPYNFNILELKKISKLYDHARENARDLVRDINMYNVRRSKKSTILQFEAEEGDELFESTWLSNALNQLDRKMITEHETIVRRKKEEEMRKVPAWLMVIIIYFVYDDLWFPSETHPMTNLVLTVFLVFVAFFFSIGQHRAFMELWNLALEVGSNLVNTVRKRLGKQENKGQ